MYYTILIRTSWLAALPQGCVLRVTYTPYARNYPVTVHLSMSGLEDSSSKTHLAKARTMTPSIDDAVQDDKSRPPVARSAYRNASRQGFVEVLTEEPSQAIGS
jgi:hypothetical protein